MSGMLGSKETEWNYRILARRPVLLKAKDDGKGKALLFDIESSLPFSVEIQKEPNSPEMEMGKEYFATVKVFTARNVEGIAADFLNLFEILDIDQPFSAFVKASWVYSEKVRFVLSQTEPS